MEWETLDSGLTLAVQDDFRFGADAVLLARFAAPVCAGEAVCDLGTGCGVIPFLLLESKLPPAMVLGVDIQAQAIELCRRSARKNRRPEIAFVQADWKTPAAIASAHSFDRVICNPPYFPQGSGRESPSLARRCARMENGDTLSDVAAAAAYLLKPGGRLCLCHRPERLADVLQSLRQHRLEPKRLQPVQQTPDRPPWLLLIEAVKGAKPGLAFLPSQSGN